MQVIRSEKQESESSLRITRLVNHPIFMSTVIGLILINAVLIGLETYPSLYDPYRNWFQLADRLLLWIFTIEIGLRILASRPYSHFFKEGWNLFDLLVVVGGHFLAGSHFITVLRIIRILRVLRAISVIPSLRRIVNAFLLTIPSLGHIMLLLGLFLYIFAVIGTFLFAEAAPEYFGSLHISLLTLFQVITLEAWASGIMWPIQADLAWAWIYFVIFILIGTFVIFNLFVGIIVSNVEKSNDDEKKYDLTGMNSELANLRKEIKELKEVMTDVQKREK